MSLLAGCSHQHGTNNPRRESAANIEAFYPPEAPDGTKSVPTAMNLVSKNPNSSDAHYALGMAYYKIRKYSKSVEEFENAIQLSPYKVNVEAYFYLGNSYDALEKPQKALHLYQQLATRNLTDKDKSRAYLCIGIEYQVQENIDKAREYYTKSVQSNARQGSAFFGLGCIAAAKGKQDQAMHYFNDAVRYAETDHAKSKAYFAIGLIFENQGKLDEANHEYKRALDLNRSNQLAKEGIERIKE